MENIFKEAKFGDKFRTRDGRMAIYHYRVEDPTHNGKYDAWHYLILANEDTPTICLSNGRFVGGKIELNDDIVCRWEEPIDEKKLDKLADEYAEGQWNAEGMAMRRDFKVGYRKAKEE